MENILQNKIFMQLLSNAGAAMQQGQPIGPALNQVTQQQISSQNYLALMKSLLGKGVDFKSDAKGKATISMEDFDPSKEGPAFDEAGILPSQGGTGVLNPSASSVGGADLAGLTTKDISQALQFKFMQEELGQKKFSDMFDMLYKTKVSAPLARAQTEAITPSITMPGTDIKITGKQYIDWWKTSNKDERTAAIKNYEYAQTDKGGSFKGSFEKFQDAARTTHKKDYDTYVEQEKAVGTPEKGIQSFNEWLLSWAKAGATTISLGEREDIETMKDKVTRESAIKSPDFPQSVKEDLMKDDRKWRASTRAEQLVKKHGISYEQAKSEAQKELHLQEMNNRIIAVYGDKVEFDYDVGWTLNGEVIRRNPYAK